MISALNGCKCIGDSNSEIAWTLDGNSRALGSETLQDTKKHHIKSKSAIELDIVSEYEECCVNNVKWTRERILWAGRMHNYSLDKTVRELCNSWYNCNVGV